MATDFLVYHMTTPVGLLLIAGTIAIPFLFWRLLLGRAFGEFGLMPLAVAFASALAGLLALCFVSAYLDFSGRVALGLLPESQRWSLLPGWTAYLALLSLWIVVPGMALIAVPLGAVLIRFRRFSLLSIGVVAVVMWLTLTIGTWAALPMNNWQRAHPVEYPLRLLREFLPGILLVPVPFFLSLWVFARRRQAGLHDLGKGTH